MITVVFVKNPFEPQFNREVYWLEYKKGKTIHEYVKECAATLKLSDMTISRNSYTINGDFLVHDGDFIVFAPVVGKGGRKNPLLIIATVALSVVSMGIGGMVAGGSLATATGWAAIGGYMAAAAVMFIGGTLIQRAFGTATPSFDGTSENPTYSWNGISTTSGQNNPIPITYGTVRSGGQTIGKYITNDGDKQYLNWLVAAGYGPLEIYDIQLNDNPVENYKDVSVEIRSGEYNQSVIPNFNDTISTKNLGYEILEDEWRTDIATGTATQGIIIYVECSNGLYYANDSGGLDETWVKIEAQYAAKGTEAWKPFFRNEYTVTISGKKSSAIRKQYRIDNLPEGEYDVRMRVVGRGHPITSTRASTRIWWTAVSSIVYDDFAYPGIALIGIRALATDQLAGSPTLKFMKRKKVVQVYNPDKGYEEKAADNPAWAAYDMVHRAEHIVDARTGAWTYISNGANTDLMLYQQFADWAEYCDTFNLKLNIEINSSGELLDVVNKYVSAVGRGIVELFGTKYGCCWDGPKEAVQMFGMGNIISGTFQETFLQTSDRANAVEVTFTNAQKDYERDTVKIYGPTFDTDEYDNTSQLSYDGITDYKQAYREGMFQLYCNMYMVRAVSFQADIDAIACTVGDVIYVSHDVPKWQISGRIHSVSGNVVVVEAVMENYDNTKQYQFAYRASKTDTRYEVSCQEIKTIGSMTQLIIGEFPETPPAAGDIFDISEISKGTKKFVVRSISRAQDFTREIEALEYNENVFNENYDIPQINYSNAEIPLKQAEPIDLQLRAEAYRRNNKIYKIIVSWNTTNKRYDGFNVYLSKDGSGWDAPVYTEDVTYTFDNLEAEKKYYIRVCSVLNKKESRSLQGSLFLSGTTSAITKAENVRAYTRYRQLKDGTPRYDVVVKWEPAGLEGRVYYKSNYVQAEEMVIEEGVPADQIGFLGGWTYAGIGANQVVIPQAVPGDTYKIAVSTADDDGNYISLEESPQTEIVVALKTMIPNTPDGFEISFNEKQVTVSWNDVTNSDIEYYEVRSDKNAGIESGALLARTNSTMAIIELNDRYGILYLFAKNLDNKYGNPAILEYRKDEPPTPTAPTLFKRLGGIGIRVDTIPVGCSGMNVYINDDDAIYSPNNSISYTCEAGIYNVYVAYTDYFGEGKKSLVSTITIKMTIDNEWIGKESISIDKVDHTITDAINDAANSAGTALDEVKQQVTDLQTDAKNLAKKDAELQQTADNLAKKDAELQNTLTGVQTNLDGLTSTVNNQAGQVSQLKQRADSIEATVTNNKKSQDAVNGSVQTQISQVSQKADGISSTVATITNNLNKDPSNSPYKSISQLQQTADTITSTISSNKAAQDEQNATFETEISQIKQTGGSITAVVAELNKNPKDCMYNSISKLYQTSNEITTTVQQNKTAQDEINDTQATTNSSVQTQISQVSQKADGISSTVATITANLNASDPSKSPYKSITQLKQTADSISSTVTANKNAQDKTNQTLQSSITQNATSITSVITNLSDPIKAAANYSAFTQLQDDINLRVKKGDVINQINVSDESILIDGKKVHITGNTVFDNNVIAKGMIQAGAVTADKLAAADITLGSNTATGVVAGAVRLNSDGMTVTGANGSSIQFGQNGMTFKDSLNNTFAALGRFCTGVANDGDTVKFANAWDVVPTVFLFPNQLQTSAVGYTNVNIWQHIEPLNITKEGFKVCCQSVLKAGSGGSFVVNTKIADWNAKTNGSGKVISYTLSVPTTATKVQINLIIGLTAKTEKEKWDDDWWYTYDWSTADIQWLVDNAIYSDYSQVAKKEGGDGETFAYTNVSKVISLNGNSQIKINMRFRGFDGDTNKESNYEEFNGTCTLQSYSLDTASDSVIAHGTAGFIAIDPNSCPYTVIGG